MFISYSHLDREFCNRLIADLEHRGVDVWIDRVGLKPGTPSWNKAIRDAISRSFAVLLLASPNSEQSDVVQGELSLARSYGCPIYPLWIGGKWEESVPLNMIQAQRIDLRETRYSSGVAAVLEEVRKVIEQRAIKHFLTKSRRDDGHRSPSPYTPQGYLSVAISAGEEVAMRPSSYQSLQSLLDDLYNYLTEKYPPYTYGNDWILASRLHGVQRLLVPWNWLVENGGPLDKDGRNDHRPLFQSNPSWQLRSPETYGLRGNTQWKIIDLFPIRAFGVLTNDPSLGGRLLSWAAPIEWGRKFREFFDYELARRTLPHHKMLAGEVDPTDYTFSAVFATKSLANGMTYIAEGNPFAY